MDIVFRTATLSDKTAIENLFMEMLRSIYQTEKVNGYECDYLYRFFADSEDRIIVAEFDDRKKISSVHHFRYEHSIWSE